MSSLRQRMQLFALQPFRFYALSCIIAMIGNGIGYIALTWIVLQLDKSITSVVVLMFTFWLPSVVFGPFAGVIVDRMSRKKLYVCLSFARGTTLLLVAAVLYWDKNLWAIYSISLLQGFLFSFVLPVIISMIREIVSEKQLLAANATVDIAYEIGNVTGMALAGFAVAVFHDVGAFVLTAILFFIAGWCASNMQLKDEQIQIRSLNVRSVMGDLRQGLQYIAQTKEVRVVYSVQLVLLVAFMTVPILVAPFATEVLHASVVQFGSLEAALSVGVILGGLCVPALAGRFGLLRVLMVLLLVLAASYAVFGFNRSILVAYALNAAIGFGLAVWPLIMTRAQDLTDKAFQGRVQAAFNALSGALILCVYLLVNLGSHYISLAHLFSVEVVFALIGFVIVLCNLRILSKDLRS